MPIRTSRAAPREKLSQDGSACASGSRLSVGACRRVRRDDGALRVCVQGDADRTQRVREWALREGAFIGYTETARSAGGSGDDIPKDSGVFESSRYTGERPSWCVDAQPQDCPLWAEGGECERNPGFMHSMCKSSCGTCVMKRKARERQGPRVYLDIKIGDDEAGGGRIVLDLFAKTHRGRRKTSDSCVWARSGWGVPRNHLPPHHSRIHEPVGIVSNVWEHLWPQI